MIVATSCVGEIDFRPEYVRKLTINGVLRLNESTQVVDINPRFSIFCTKKSVSQPWALRDGRDDAWSA